VRWAALQPPRVLLRGQDFDLITLSGLAFGRGRAPTLLELVQREQVERLYDARFVRMWDFYLAASEMAFREQAMMVFQMQLTKPLGVVPMTRDYITRDEARLRALEAGSRPPLRLAGE
jgi:Mycolic acid cyclopropane synthetase